MPAAAPLKVYPVVVMPMLVPTPACAKVNVGLPAKVTTSDPTMPLNAAVPVAVAAVVPLYSLFTPVRPVIVSALPVMFALKLGWVKL